MRISPSTSRRQFIKTVGTAITAFNIVPRHVLGGRGYVPPSEKVNVAFVGVGGKGQQLLQQLFDEPDAQIIALADPAARFSLEDFYYKGEGGRRPAKALVEAHYAAKTPNFNCAEYEDFRLMLEKENAIDAIVCATPDHLHACVSIRAMRDGKHVYCEKPLTHNLWEAREVARVARETGVATQMGNQGHSTVGIRETVEHIRAGTIGAVREVFVWADTKRWNPDLTGVPAGASLMPSGLNWDLWLGPREPRPFHSAYFPVKWRDFWAFGGFAMGDFGCHELDSSVWAFDLAAPSRVEPLTVGPTDAEIAPHGAIIYFDFPAAGAQKPLRITWYDGGIRPKAPAALGKFPLPKRGVMFVGDKGVMQCGGTGGAPRIFPESLRTSMAKPAATIKRSNGHLRDWIDACKGGSPASSEFGYAARLTEITLLGVLALRMRKPIEWDAEKMAVPGMPEADEVIRGTYREGWKIV